MSQHSYDEDDVCELPDILQLASSRIRRSSSWQDRSVLDMAKLQLESAHDASVATSLKCRSRSPPVPSRSGVILVILVTLAMLIQVFHTPIVPEIFRASHGFRDAQI